MMPEKGGKGGGREGRREGVRKKGKREKEGLKDIKYDKHVNFGVEEICHFFLCVFCVYQLLNIKP